ncbi:MAG: hypothetical protein V3U24_09015 [Candidatus Neomarinimicrobiota bacterium]
MVRQTARVYRVAVMMDQMNFVADGKGGQTFHIDLKSNRNNFEMVLLVGYIAAGEAMKTGVKPSEIHVTVEVPLGEGYRLMTRAKIDDVERLLDGEVNAAQFARLIEYL